MPIRPEEKARYPKDWKAISLEVRERAGWVCEGSPAYPECRAVNREPHPVTGSIVVLTVAHLDHVPENVGEPGNRTNLMAWCQRCHLTYDAAHHRKNASASRMKARGNLDLFASTGGEGSSREPSTDTCAAPLASEQAGQDRGGAEP